MSCAMHLGPSDSENDVHALVTYIRKLATFLKRYSWLIEAYVADFFVLDHWQQLPKSWIFLLDELQPNEIASLLSKDSWLQRHVWPLSLLAFRACTTGLCLPSHLCDALKDPSEKNGGNGMPQNFQLNHCFRRHVKPKKQHEIIKLGQVVRCLCDHLSCRHVVDVGAGLGHLSRLLSFGHGLKTTTLEATDFHAPKASQFDKEVQRDILRGFTTTRKNRKLQEKNGETQNMGLLPEMTPDIPSHLISTIPVDVSEHNFKKMLHNQQQHKTDQSHDNSEAEQYTNLVNGDNELLTMISPIENGDTGCSGDISEPPPTNTLCGKHTPCLIKAYTNTAHITSHKVLNKSPIVRTKIETDEANQTIAQNTDLQQPQLVSTEANRASIFQTNNACTVQSPTSAHQCRINHQHTTVCEDENTSSRSIINPDINSTFVIAGLHACGDLTPTLLRLFVNTTSAVGLASVGCCYMKLNSVDAMKNYRSGTGEDTDKKGYPMSCAMQDSELSYEAREMACHFIHAYHKRLLDAPTDLISHCYRAALQEIILAHDPHAPLGSIKLTMRKAHQKPFAEYAQLAMRRLGLTDIITTEQLCQAQKRLQRWRRVVAFYTLRLSLAPIVETLLLLDKILYLQENGIKSVLLPIFNPEISPRNFVLLATKRKEDDIQALISTITLVQKPTG